MLDLKTLKGPLTVMITGDSVTDCGRTYPYADYTNNLGGGYVSILHEQITCTYPEKKIRLVNAGISGNTSRDVRNRWEKDLENISPSYATLLIGVNDVWRRFDTYMSPERAVSPGEYEENLRFIAEDAAKRLNGFMIIAPFLFEANDSDPFKTAVLEYGRICKHVAADTGAEFLDIQKDIDNILKTLNNTALSPDRVHPNRVAHALIAKAILRKWNYEF